MADIRNLTDLAYYAQQQIEQIQRMQQDLAEQYGEGVSPSGLVAARTGPGGLLVDLRLDPNARRLPTEELAEEIVAAVTTAQREFAARADEIMAPLLAMRPSEQTVTELEAGMSRLEELSDTVARLARERESS
ncbi:Conserved DNA-binding protein YbaB [Micromonospora pallida]|uniref:Conserved DNA-binding protein YbaB n=1 Tax=Micromonospora pallida TaxID=145854 RepID=A0A1C6TDD9_9ACTN|nr:YbaB/EbfC family nucleoid-associated protein [Micromonospora pallida]SCL39836.1 Conserved DNA-binding protein YbaB [Micromonospora pallida]